MLPPQLDQTAQNKICILLVCLSQLLLPNRHQYIDRYSIEIQHHKKKKDFIDLYSSLNQEKHSVGIREDLWTLIKEINSQTPSVQFNYSRLLNLNISWTWDRWMSNMWHIGRSWIFLKVLWSGSMYSK